MSEAAGGVAKEIMGYVPVFIIRIYGSKMRCSHGPIGGKFL
jgi:hypothetical protein